jgi:putative flippase GtrA
MLDKTQVIKSIPNIVLFSRSFRRFVFVGGIGFCIDGGLLTVLIQHEWDIIAARTISFLLAVSVTWILNRMWTFSPGFKISKCREYLYYFGTQSGGALINLAIFFCLISVYPYMQDFPLIPFAIGSVIALIFNYIVSKNLVFKHPHIK